GLHGARIEGCTVAAAGQRQGGEDFAIDCAEDDTSGRAAASAATHREKNVVPGIDGQARRPVALVTEVEMAGHLEGFGVHHGDVVRVGHVKIEMPSPSVAPCSTAALAPVGPMASTLPTIEPSLGATPRRL